jgi:hypothetical protein
VPWVFGDEIVATRLSIRAPSLSEEEEQKMGASVLYRHTSMATGDQTAGDEATADQIVVTTRRRKKRSAAASQSASVAGMKLDEDDDGFFENDCDVLDFADDRV